MIHPRRHRAICMGSGDGESFGACSCTSPAVGSHHSGALFGTTTGGSIVFGSEFIDDGGTPGPSIPTLAGTSAFFGSAPGSVGLTTTSGPIIGNLGPGPGNIMMIGGSASPFQPSFGGRDVGRALCAGTGFDAEATGPTTYTLELDPGWSFEPDAVDREIAVCAFLPGDPLNFPSLAYLLHGSKP